MARSTSYFGYLLALWVVSAHISSAQETPHLRIQPDRLLHASEVEREATVQKDSIRLAEAWYLYGKTYVLAGDFRTAQAYFMKALRVHEPRGDSPELSRLYIRLSESEARLGHLDESFRLANLALDIARRIQSAISLIRAYGNLGQLCEKKWGSQLMTDRGKYNRILDYYRKEESLCYKTNDSMGIAEVSAKLGVLFTKTNDPQAIPYLRKAVHLFGRSNKEGNRVDAMLHLVSAYLMANKTRLAFQTLHEAEKLYTTRKLDDYVLQLGLARRNVLYYQAKNQWQEAFNHLSKQHELEKSQLLADNDGAITRLNLEYETEKKEALLTVQRNELARRTENLQTQQRFTMATSALLIVTAGMSIIFFRLYRKNQRISRQNGELVKEQNHRVKNNLQVVSSLLSLQSKRLTDETAKKAIDETRLRVQSMAILHQQLYDGDKLAAVNLNEFIPELIGGVLRAYGYPTLQPQFAIDDITLPADKAVPLGLILNELTTNACKYAFPHNQAPSLSIHCHQKSHLIELTVTDNGPGLEGPGLERSDVSGPGLEGPGQDDDDVDAVRAETFGMQLIQAQVKQVRGTHRFSPVGLGAGRGTRFTMTFNQ